MVLRGNFRSSKFRDFFAFRIFKLMAGDANCAERISWMVGGRRWWKWNSDEICVGPSLLNLMGLEKALDFKIRLEKNIDRRAYEKALDFKIKKSFNRWA